MALTEKKQTTHDLLQAQLELWHHTFSYMKSMALKCAVELRIPDAIHSCGGEATITELLTKIKVHPSKLAHLHRLMRVLTNSRVLTVSAPASPDGEAMYGLSPGTRLLVGDDTTSSLMPFVRMILDKILIDPFFCMSPWFADDTHTTFFQMAHGHPFWELEKINPAHSRLFDDGMVADSRFLMDIVVKECCDVFLGINSLVDVAGGEGAAAIAIAKAFPHLKCTVLDLPHVVAQAPADANVQFVAGDMFKYIPPANALFFKWVFHDWADEDCVKILKKCKEAIPSKDAGGKVIIIDMVVGSGPQDIISKEVQVLFDLFIMCVEGVERDEHQWKKIFFEAGFSDYKITPVLGVRSIIELYP